MLRNFHDVFRPAASKQPGFLDVKMLRLRSLLAGAAPAGANYRFELTFASEEQRQAWVATGDTPARLAHDRVDTRIQELHHPAI
jgi:hypothetical protein